MEHDVRAPRSLAILGRVPNAAGLALRRILRAKERDQALAVLDYQGTLASFLTERNKGHLHQRPLLWVDLGNRRKPVALFRFGRSPGMRPALRAFLLRCIHLAAEPIPNASVDSLVDLGWRLAENGMIGLAALVRGLGRPELTLGYHRDRHVAEGLDRLSRLLVWLLRFPAVWCASEGNNTLEIGHVLKIGGTVWLDMPGSHLERHEHQIVASMAEAMVMEALLSLGGEEDAASTKKPPPIILYAFPSTSPLSFGSGDMRVKHVGLFSFSAKHPPPQAARAWMEADADCWVAGDVGTLPNGWHSAWFTPAESARLEELRAGELWVRSGVDRKAVTMLVRAPEHATTLSQHARWHAQRSRRLSPVKQFSSCFAEEPSPSPGTVDLYRKLCVRENLLAGWGHVRTHNRYSYGSDQVTIDQFGTQVDHELDRLLDELNSGSYRCRPLRVIRVPKPNGEERVLKVACVRDRVVQAACLQLLEPIFDPRFSRFSFAFRPGRNAHQAVALARSIAGTGRKWAVTADIRRCFDSLDHDVLLRLVGDVIGDRDLLSLIRHWLSVDVIDFRDIIPSELGVPQGEAISPLLANVYLDPLDKAFEQNGNAFVRYADDYLILAASEAEALGALQLMRDFLHGVLRLELKPAKTQHCQLTDGVGFLGFRLDANGIFIQPEKLDRARGAIRDLMQAIAAPQSTLITKSRALFRLNALIRGFRNYFHFDDTPGILVQLRALDDYLDEMARALFSSNFSRDLGWISRERFVPKAAPAKSSPPSTSATGVTGAYLFTSSLLSTDTWLLRPDESMPVSTSQGGSGQQATPVNTPDPVDEDDVSAEKDVVLNDGRLHVMARGCYVTVSRGDLVVRRRRQEYYRIPLSSLALLYLEGKGIAVSADMTIRLSQDGVPVVFTPLIGSPGAVVQPVHSERSDLRRQQVLRTNDSDIIGAGLSMLAAKVANQASVLKYFARYRKRNQDPAYDILTRGADDIRSISSVLGGLDPRAVNIRSAAMGHEGRAAARYWSSIAHLVPEQLCFPGRHTRHASDPVNSVVNYVYGMLYGEVWRAVVRNGLDPYFGILHGAERDHGSLVFDVIEEFRAPFGDRLVLGMIGRGFVPVLDADGRLRTASRRKLVKAFHKLWRRNFTWHSKVRSPAEILELQVKRLKNAFLGQEEYRPFKFRW